MRVEERGEKEGGKEKCVGGRRMTSQSSTDKKTFHRTEVWRKRRPDSVLTTEAAFNDFCGRKRKWMFD